MVYLALAAIGVNFLLVYVIGMALGRQQRQHAREREMLINQLMHLTGKPWLQAPADERPAVEEPEREKYTASPEQYTHV